VVVLVESSAFAVCQREATWLQGFSVDGRRDIKIGGVSEVLFCPPFCVRNQSLLNVPC
jgi:hypothetical protein